MGSIAEDLTECRPSISPISKLTTIPSINSTSFGNLHHLLDWAAKQPGSKRIQAYPEGNTTVPRNVYYRQLQDDAQKNARRLEQIEGFRKGAIVLLHFKDHLDSIVWFWSTLHAGCIPAMSSPLPNDPSQCKKHLEHLYDLLDDPICITRAKTVQSFETHEAFRISTVEALESNSATTTTIRKTDTDVASDQLAALVLTSGSTGNAKAVCLTHDQMLASIAGKSTIAKLPDDHTFLNWVGIDHVAGLLEAHLEAIYAGMDQIYVQPVDLISDPPKFLELIQRHRVARTFAPNFFLASLPRAMEDYAPDAECPLDVSCLRCLVSGGESNPVGTREAVANLLRKYSAAEHVLMPGFGMSETCAGSIYNRECPTFDMRSGAEFASLGHCIPGIEMRIGNETENGRPKDSGEGIVGKLEVRGPIVFKKYYNNLSATEGAFSADGWFDTGDEGMIDETGALHIVGRIKDTIVANGVKFAPTDIETSLNEAAIKGAVSSFYVCFSYRSPGFDTEDICIAYLPTYASNDADARLQTTNSITRAVMLQTGVCPYLLPLDSTILQKSRIGKLSRGKIRTGFNQGRFVAYQEENENSLQQKREAETDSVAANDTEAKLLEVFRAVLKKTLGIPEYMVGMTSSVFEIGINSLQLIMLKRRIGQNFDIADLPIIKLMTSPTVRTLATTLDTLSSQGGYDPVFKLRENGDRTPLWCFHPGVGEVLVFLGLAKFFDDRPVYALRARGFNEGESFFGSIEETVKTYYDAIKEHQPQGPYALTGYSYGTMLAFETAKLLEHDADGQQVSFLGSLNLPPHIKMRMQQLDWTECILHLAFFLSLMTEDEAGELRSEIKTLSREDIVTRIVDRSKPGRLAELSLTQEALANWADLSYGLQSMASEYEPAGQVVGMDIFYCNPLVMVASSKEQWLDEHMSKWKDFSETAPRFHEVDGAHYTMLSTDHVQSFQKTFRKAVAKRGI